MEILNLLFPILIVGVFYFFIIRPQSKMRKDQQTFSESLEKGAEVVTSSGIIGRINKIEDNIVTLQVDTKTFIRITRGSVSKDMTESLASPDEAAKAK